MQNSEYGMKNSVFSAPYLYIYYFQGKVMPCNEMQGKDFMGCWEEGETSFLFFSKPSQDKAQAISNQQPQLTLLDQFQMTYEEWHGGKFEPFTVGSFFIAPPWEISNIPYPRANITLDPGVVFGTGTHPTTHDCLEMLEFIHDPEEIKTVLDLGTGTGLLAVAAARLGCPRIIGVDFNFLATKTAKQNVILNQLENRVLIVQGRAEEFINYKADLLIANIHYDVMRHLIASKNFLSNKYFILSGLLRSESREIEYKLSQMPVEIIKKQEREGVWHTFLGKCNDSCHS